MCCGWSWPPALTRRRQRRPDLTWVLLGFARIDIASSRSSDPSSVVSNSLAVTKLNEAPRAAFTHRNLLPRGSRR
jgi:hypothetical protein